MRGVKIVDARKVETRNWPEPAPAGEEVVVRVEAAALCGSDLHGLYETPGEKKCIPGHEAAGVVTAVDAARRFKEGDRVVCLPFLTCGVCDLCRAGIVAYCRAKKGVYGFSLDGFQAQHVRIHESSLLPLPEPLSFEQGCLMLDPIGTPFHAHRRIATNGTHTVGVFGVGPMGLGTLVLAVHLGARVVAIDPAGYRRELAVRLGAAAAIDPGAGDVVEQVRAATGGWGLDRAIECCGKAEALAWAMELTRPLGHVAIIGENSQATINQSKHLIHREMTLSGNCGFWLGEYGQIVRLYELGFRGQDIITHRFSLEQAAEAYALFERRQTGKVVFLPNAG